MTEAREPTREEVSAYILSGRYDCTGCGINTSRADEYYMIQHDLWASTSAGRGMLCVGCLEEKIGRRLEPADFIDCDLNFGPYMRDGSPRRKSRRLAERMGLTAEIPS